MQKQEIKIVLGIGFGDEGKGNTIQWLCRQALFQNKSVAVVRFSGGPQAAHRIVDKVDHICSSYGSGTLLNVPTYWINPENTFIDPIAVMQEREVLLSKGIDLYPQIIDVENTRWITPYDIIANQDDSEILSNGSCGKGIYCTFKRYNNKPYVTDPDSLLNLAKNYWYLDKDNYLNRRFKQAYYQLLSNQHNIPLSSYDVLIYEGSQGLLLDMDSKFYPHVTPSNTGLQSITDLKDAEIYLCSRLYLTRHGNGYIPKGDVHTFFKIEDVCNPFNKFQGNMKYGFLEQSLLDEAFKTITIPINMVFTHCDTMKHNVVPLRHEQNNVYYLNFNSFIKYISNRFKNIQYVIGSFNDRSTYFKYL